mmetsp:Transcript_102975/g.322160  ORF Transcript_102975/g.322160 Transcript_102975/m.322160 type:complete len:346 (-) Transcript_102975:300-1337(-)
MARMLSAAARETLPWLVWAWPRAAATVAAADSTAAAALAAALAPLAAEGAGIKASALAQRPLTAGVLGAGEPAWTQPPTGGVHGGERCDGAGSPPAWIRATSPAVKSAVHVASSSPLLPASLAGLTSPVSSNSAIRAACMFVSLCSSARRASIFAQAPPPPLPSPSRRSSNSAMRSACEDVSSSSSAKRASRERTTASSARAAASSSATWEAVTTSEDVPTGDGKQAPEDVCFCLACTSSDCSLSTCSQLSLMSLCRRSESCTTRVLLSSSACSRSTWPRLSARSRCRLSASLATAAVSKLLQSWRSWVLLIDISASSRSTRSDFSASSLCILSVAFAARASERL